MNVYLINEDTLIDIADAIRSKIFTTDKIKVSDFSALINQINVGGNSALWAYLDQTTLYINQADGFVQHGTTLEVL